MTSDKRVRTEFAVDRFEKEMLLRVIRGDFQAGDYLPGIHRLAESCGLSANTVRAAVGRLVARGLLTEVPGHGTRVEELLETCDISLLLAMIGDEHDAERALELEAQLLDLMAVIFLEVAYRAASCRTDEHLKWFNHYLRVVLDCVDQDGHVTLLCSAQYQLLRVLAAAGGSIAFTVLLNAFRPYLAGRPGLELFPPETWSQLGTALQCRDVSRARSLLQRCFDRRTSRVLQLLAKARGGSDDSGGPAAVELELWASNL